MEKRKTIAKFLGLAIIIATVIFCIINIVRAVRTGNQNIIVNASKKYYTSTNLTALIEIKDINQNDLQSDIKVRLLNENRKKVKGISGDYKASENVSINLPISGLQSGTYYLEITAKSKKGKDKVAKQIQIIENDKENVTISLDKGIYKPGDEINFRAMVTGKSDDKPIEKNVQVCIYDGNDNRVYNNMTKTSGYGIISGNFKLADEVNSGIYNLKIITDNVETTKSFKVDPYILPKFEVKIDTDKQEYIVGDTLKGTVSSNYFFGEPVKDASVKININNKEIKTGKTNDLGEYQFEYKIDTAGKYAINIETIDTSNYLIESTKTIYAGTNKFEIEVLPENRSIVNGISNDVYIFTRKADGTPVKTYITVRAGNFSRQVATDEFGIGKFNVNENFSGTTQKFSISATDLNDNTVTKNVDIAIVTKNLIVKTDKPKYEAGEAIKLNIVSNIDVGQNNIYVFKNDRLLKLITTDKYETEVNLEDTYGIIDIYVVNSNVNNNANNNSGIIDLARVNNAYNGGVSAKRTIFIDSSKKMQIGINTDFDEYKPGEKINISFSTIDENNNNIDAALLVSMLDEAVLALGENDLSIDNIKMAISDIKFTDDLDAATLYTSLIGNTSEQMLMGLLLKQADKDLSLGTERFRNDKDEFMSQAIIFGGIVLIEILIVVGMVAAKNRTLKSVLEHIIVFLGTYATITLLFIYKVVYVLEDFIDSNMAVLISSLIVTLIASLAAYILLIYKFKNRLLKTSIDHIIAIISVILFIIYIQMNRNFSPLILLIAYGIICVIALIFIPMKRVRNGNISNVSKNIAMISTEITTYVLFAIISVFVASRLDYHFDIEEMALFGFVLLFIYVLKFLTQIRKDKIEKRETVTIPTSFIITGAIGGVLLIVFIIAIGNMTFSSRGLLSRAQEAEDRSNAGSSSGGLLNPSSLSPNDITADYSTSSIDSIIKSGDSFFGSANTKKQETAIQEMEQLETKLDESIDDNIRNVFLESMCFIPELITENGKASLDLKLSDNITTWNIQTVGNSKNGTIGYSSHKIKAFKPFFVDFELPANAVKGDILSIPVTVYNYTDNRIDVSLKIKEENWFTLNMNADTNVVVDAKQTKLVYVPIVINEYGAKQFRVEGAAEDFSDIIEKTININPNGFKMEKVSASGTLEGNTELDILYLDKDLEDTRSVKVKMYPTPMAQVVEGLENIFRMPTGCFEQISSSLYPNILVLKYMQDNNSIDESLKQKALGYISSGYQKILTYEVTGEKGGFSLYGNKSAETVLTAYGLMEFKDLSSVYFIDDNLLNRMKNYLFGKQKSDGSFEITGSHIGGANSRDNLALNAYIIWSLSTAYPDDAKLNKSIQYLVNNLDKMDDNYTLALTANALANVGDKRAKNVCDKLLNNIQIEGDIAYVTSNIKDYYGSYGRTQNIQTTALTSMALTKLNTNSKTNGLLINYIIKQKDTYGTWYSTQATILALKAMINYNESNKVELQEIKVSVNGREEIIKVENNPLDIYELKFDKLNKENKLILNIPKGKIVYEVLQEYYVPYENVNLQDNKIKVSSDIKANVNVNELVTNTILVENQGKDTIQNAMVVINIPQGFRVQEDSLMLLKHNGLIEKYEMNYSTINLYLRDFKASGFKSLEIKFRPGYPGTILGGTVKVYDYYNPDIDGISLPKILTIK